MSRGLTEPEAVASEQVARPGATSAPRRKRHPRRALRKVLVVGHRWTALVLGVLLVAITTSGAVLVYKPELQRWASGAYSDTGGPRVVSMPDALATVQRERPDFTPGGIDAENGLYRVSDTDYDSWVAVDWTTGKIAGDGSNTGAVWGFLDNLHECLLTCEEYPGYLGALVTPVPELSGWPGFADVTYGGLILGLMGLLLLLLAVSGVVLWWPATGRWLRSVKVRWRKGRFARDYDLHQVVGMIAVPLLLLWAVTGAGFELPFVEKAWFAATPGATPPESEFGSNELAKGHEKDPDITLAQAITAATRVAPPGAPLVSASFPADAEEDATGTYGFYFADGFDPYAKTTYPGDLGVSVDRHDPTRAEVTYGAPGSGVSADLWESWNYPAHAGYIVNAWWRIFWFVLGLVPALLMVTGISTWLVRLKAKRGRKRRSRARAAAAAA